VEVVNVALPPPLPLARHLSTTARLLRQVLTFAPDAAHCFKPKAYAGLVALCLWMMQRLRLWRGQLVVDADDWEGPAGWNAVGGYSWPQRRFFARQELWGLRHCDAVTVASKRLEQRVAKMRGGSGRVRYLPNGVEHRPGTPEPMGSATPTVLLYTRFVECSAAQVARIWRQVTGAIPAARLVVAGAGLRGEELVLAKLLAREGLDDRVHLLGWLEPGKLSEVFSASHVAMLPANDSVLVQAKCPARLLDMMAAGVPVVTHDVGEYAAIVGSGMSGVVVPEGDQDAMAAAVVTLLRNDILRRQLAAAAQRRARNAFSWERLAERVEQVYAGCA
jgi:glycosyltransferase involved in cell wall biosynthesis